MTNEELLGQIAVLLDEKLEEKLEIKLEEKLDKKLEEKLDKKLEEKLDKKLDEKLDKRFEEQENRLNKRIEEVEKRLDKKIDDKFIKFREEMFVIEYEHSKKLDIIFDKLVLMDELRKEEEIKNKLREDETLRIKSDIYLLNQRVEKLEAKCN